MTDGPATRGEPTKSNSRGAEKAPLWKRLLPIIGGLAIVVVLFGWVRPQFMTMKPFSEPSARSTPWSGSS